MKELTFATLLAVFEEVFGFWLFWLLVIAAVAIIVGYLYVLFRDRAMSMQKFFWAQLSMPFGALAAVLLVLLITDSQISDLGGPVDIIVFLGIAVLGAVGVSILVYTVESLLWPMKRTGARSLR